MKTTLITVFMLFGFYQLAFSQSKLPIVKASSTIADIREDGEVLKGIWKITPEANPDIHRTSSKEVTFYTDIDSISFTIDPKVGAYNFIVLLNGKDSAYTQIAYQPSYLEKLKQGKEYSYTDNRFIPTFTYQAATDSSLTRIREELKLDSIAGQGNEISKIINLMYWVHDIVHHDGNSQNPKFRNAIDLISVCKVENRGVNCRMLATILNECYLAIGISSRFITCMPKETEFEDCHVINMVYSNDLQKWVWMDPTFCAYVMNENGEVLGLGEVRERLIDGRTLILNPDANWNKQTSQSKEYYLEKYMAKNLYRLQCPLVSEYNTETYVKGKQTTYVELLPLDGIEQTPQKEVKESKDYTRTYYKTNNPDLFWKKP